MLVRWSLECRRGLTKKVISAVGFDDKGRQQQREGSGGGGGRGGGLWQQEDKDLG